MLLEDLFDTGRLARFVLDEIHVVKSWGDDFRPAYQELKTLKQKFPKTPILGLTATATVKVRAELSNILGFENDFLVF